MKSERKARKLAKAHDVIGAVRLLRDANKIPLREAYAAVEKWLIKWGRIK
jgi:hypothetical protein